MPQPEAIQAVYATDVISNFDLHKPQKMNELFAVRGDQGLGYMRIVESMGFKEDVAGLTYENYEEDWKVATFHSLSNVAAPGPGNNAVVTLQPADLDANNRFYPRRWMQVQIPANRVIATIISIDKTVPTAPVLTLRPNDMAKDIGAIAAGTTLIISSSNFSEGSGQPDSIVSGTYKNQNDLQIIKDTVSATGDEMTQEPWVYKLTGEGISKDIPVYYLKGQIDLDYRMNLMADGAMLMSQRITNSMIDPDTGRQVRATEGLIPYTSRVGQTLNYTVGLFGIPKFNQAVRLFDKEFSGKYICCLNGIGLDIQIEDELVDYFKDTNIDYAKDKTMKDVFGGDSGLGMSIGFKYLTKGSYTFLLKRMGIFSHAKLYGAPGYTTPDLGVWIPMAMKKDKLGRKNVPTFGMRYKKLGPYNRMQEVWDVNGAGPGLKVTQYDIANHYQRMQIGFHGIGGNSFVLMEPNYGI